MDFKAKISNTLFNIFSRKLDKKLLVIESDDWGSIRVSSRENRDALLKLGYAVKSNPYQMFDGLETDMDIQVLGDTLQSYKNSKVAHPIFTLNNSTSNPDFEAIKENKFEAFFREAFNKTYFRHDDSKRVVDLIRQGEGEGLFNVQFHGAEHLHSKRWMSALKKNSQLEKEAFEHGVFSPAVSHVKGYSMEYMDALDYDSAEEVGNQKMYLEKGVGIFKEVWGKSPQSFIAPCYRWSNALEPKLRDLGIRYIQGQRAQLHPKDKPGYGQRKIYHYTGQRNKHGQIYTVRNVMFEPSLHGASKALDIAKRQIDHAFRWKIPAIVSSHRINYTSRIEVKNRDTGIQALNDLLSWVTKTYPEVEFHSSESLGKILEKTE